MVLLVPHADADADAADADADADTDTDFIVRGGCCSFCSSHDADADADADTGFIVGRHGKGRREQEVVSLSSIL